MLKLHSGKELSTQLSLKERKKQSHAFVILLVLKLPDGKDASDQ
jgi:hypothetical protein